MADEIRCPKCGGTTVAKLASSDYAKHFQCGNPRCFENFSIPCRPPIRGREMPEEEQPTKEAATMAKLSCGKCGRDFIHPKRHETHEARCKGVKSAPSARGARRRATAPAGDPDVRISGSGIPAAIASLKEERKALEGRIGEFDHAIATLEKLGGGGGPR